MTLTRRAALQSLGGAAVMLDTAVAWAAPAEQALRPPVSLPDKANFSFDGVYLNAAFTHLVGQRTSDAIERYVATRRTDIGKIGPGPNPRNEAVRLFARLINAEPSEVAVVPSTLIGENLIAAALGLGAGAGVVTDALHYDASLIMYGEMHKKGMPLAVLAPKNNKIDYAELEAAITRDIKLVAISSTSSPTGYRHDLKKVCEIAHRKGAMVYADIIQEVGAIPFDVKESGVDFCCSGTYKRLMGEFGTAFLYVRPDRLADLKRVQVGWRSIKSYTEHVFPFDPPGPPVGDWELGSDTGKMFDVSTPSWLALAAVSGAITYINEIGVEKIGRHIADLLTPLQTELPKHGFTPLTPREFQGPSVAFAYKGAEQRFDGPLKAAKISISTYPNRIRISPSVYNDGADIEALLKVLTAKA